MNQQRIDRIIDSLTATAGGITHDTTITDTDAELLLDAVELIRGLVLENLNLEAVISNQRAEVQRLRSQEGTY
jgi:hypothetical protein